MSPRARRRLVAVAFTWVLAHSRDGKDWSVASQFQYPTHCLQARSAEIDREVRGSIGGVLASQPLDNPLRQEAYRRAERHVEEQWRCAEVR